MKLFGFEIGRAKGAPDIATKPQYTTSTPQGVLTPWFNDYYLRKVSGDFYEALREGIPVIDAAIRRLISLDGTIKVIGDNMDCVQQLEDFNLNVPVNDHQKGIHAFLENCSNEKFEQGFSLPEFIATPKLDDIAELRVPDSKQIIFRRGADGRTEPWYRYAQNYYPPAAMRYTSPGTLVDRILNARYNQALNIGGIWEEKLNPANKLYFSINNENTDPHGVALMRSMEFCAKVLATIQNSICNEWERFGDPSYHVKYKTNKKDLGTTTLEERRQKIQSDFNAAIRAKREGRSADFVTAVNTDADMIIEVIGKDLRVLEITAPAGHVLDQIVAKTGLPPWLLGINTRAVQGQAALEIEAALADAKIRQLAMLPVFIRLYSTLLRLRGRSWKQITTDPNKPGDWGIVFETPNLRDLVSQAQARFLNAQADQMGAAGKPQETITVPASSRKSSNPPHSPLKVRGEAEGGGCSCGCKVVHGAKEEHRPVPWPALDEVEKGYEDRLKSDWEDLRQQVFTICKLTDADIALGMRMAKDNNSGDPLGKFTLSEEQKAAIQAALAGFIATYAVDAEDSPIDWYYGQSYSLGLIQAARMVGAERPILDILKNSEIFDELAANGFQLVKDNATTAIVDKILAEMQAHVLAGSNPLSVANRLNKLFGDQNSSWERLARTEMSMAAEQAKVDEWGKQGINVNKAVIAGKDTHPRCRCANTVQEVNGKWYLLFVPSPDACALCVSLASGPPVGT